MSRSHRDWFEASPFGPADRHGVRRPERGLRFACTMCGNCCTGPPGTVMVDERERAALAQHLGLSAAEFDEQYTRTLDEGVTLVERLTAFGHDCVFLDRTTVPGRAVCGVYEHRPSQCRTWPFWQRNLTDERAWDRAAATCPGMNSGPLRTAREVRLTRDSSPI
ncbi:MAG: YkgJ family cysteine cluster protein [Phycisphaerales bacterium]|jgi:Fe-S-cluster containining protein